MPHSRSEDLPADSRSQTRGPTSASSSDPSGPAAPTPDSPRAQNPFRPVPPGLFPAHPALKLLADSRGHLVPELEEWQDDPRLTLDPGTLMPAWWPEGPGPNETWSHPEEKLRAYRDSLNWSLPEDLRLNRPDLLDTPTIQPKTSTPLDVLKSLLQLRYVLLPDEAPIPE